MHTLILNTKDGEREESLNKAANIIKNDGTVVFPTETVYGLGANALSKKAVEKIYIAKGRPSDNPLIVHISDKSEIHTLTDHISDTCMRLMEAFWPGPLTLIFNKKEEVPDVVTCGLKTVAVRMPQNELALALIRKAGVPIAGPSANLSGKPSPTKVEHVIHDLMGRVDAILVGEDCRVGLESTVVDALADPPVILRPGGISKEEIESVVGPVVLNNDLGDNKSDIPKAPGMKYTHYAPKAPVIVFRGSVPQMVKEINCVKNKKEEEKLKVGILATDETMAYYTGCVISVGSRKNFNDVARNLFHVLRSFDEEDIDIILSESFSTEGMGSAIMNRILKSAGYHIIDAGG